MARGQVCREEFVADCNTQCGIIPIIGQGVNRSLLDNDHSERDFGLECPFDAIAIQIHQGAGNFDKHVRVT